MRYSPFFIMKKIYFVGAGKVGTTLAGLLHGAKFHVKYIYEQNVDFRKLLKVHLPDTFIPNIINPNDLEESDVIFLTVNDEQIQLMAKELASVEIDWKHKIVLHAAGIRSSHDLNSLKNLGAETGSLHPLQSFNKKFLPQETLNNVYFIFEGTKNAESFCREMVAFLKGNFFKINANKKTNYHLGAVVYSNFLTALLQFGEMIFLKAGINNTESKRMIRPIVYRIIENYFNFGAKKSITGPLVRGDIETIEKHIQIMQDYFPGYINLYKELSNLLLNNLANMNSNQKTKLAKILNDMN